MSEKVTMVLFKNRNMVHTDISGRSSLLKPERLY